MLSAAVKRSKFQKEKNERSQIDAESGFHSEIDLSSSIIAPSISKSSDLSVSPAKKKVLATRRASLNQNSAGDLYSVSSCSSGYQSHLSSSSNLTGSLSTASLSRQSRTPKKRQSGDSENEENLYNSFQYVSPPKIPKKDERISAKLILKEKCSSENIILHSTPIRKSTQNFQKFKSFHPQNTKPFSPNIEETEQISNEEANRKPLYYAPDNNSFNISSFNFSNDYSSANLSANVRLQHDIPSNTNSDYSKLFSGELKKRSMLDVSSAASADKFVSSYVFIRPTFSTASIDSTKTERKEFYNGRAKIDILGQLQGNYDVVLDKILGHLDEKSLLCVSHVSIDYRKIITSNKSLETKRQNYLKQSRAVKENKAPTGAQTKEEHVEPLTLSEKKNRKPFSDLNRSKRKAANSKSPKTLVREVQHNIRTNTKCKKCPRCSKTAKITQIRIRNSPRKRVNFLKLSPSKGGRVQKHSKTFLSKTSIESSCFSEVSSLLYATLPNLDDELSRSPNRSSDYESLATTSNSSSDDTMDTTTGEEVYEYATCGAIGCGFKFCVKCNCKYHPRQQCRDLSPPSPNRNVKNVSAGACTMASRKSLRRLKY